MPRSEVDEIRDAMHFTTDNSALETSESADSYHLLFRPTYYDAAPTVRLLRDALGPLAKRHHIELYPQRSKGVRLPFGTLQAAADVEKYGFRTTWQDRMYWFEKLDDYDLMNAPLVQQEFDLIRHRPKVQSVYREGQALLQDGLIRDHSRHESQWQVLYVFWRRNMTPELAEQATWEWIKRSHNGHSQDILTNPRAVHREIQKQARWIWDHFEHADILPDDAHNTYNGWISPSDIVHCLHLVDGSLPRAKLLVQLVQYMNPRRHRRGGISVHSDKLSAWASVHTYPRYLEDLQRKRVLTRSDEYVRGIYAKRIKLTRWPWSTADQSILVDNRTPESLSQLILAAWPDRRDAHTVLEKAGMNRSTRYRLIAESGQEEEGTRVNYMCPVLGHPEAVG